VSDFKVKIALQKRSQTSPKLILAFQNIKKLSKNFKKYYYDILVYAQDNFKRKGKILQNFVAFSEYMNFTTENLEKMSKSC
jgi:hypothetical protein